jgi:hypothetical protein
MTTPGDRTATTPITWRIEVPPIGINECHVQRAAIEPPCSRALWMAITAAERPWFRQGEPVSFPHT